MNNKTFNKDNLNYTSYERPSFLMVVTFIGGYMNAYTYITRNEILANMHTANMSKLGINIALNNFDEALHYFIPILACIFGATFSEFTKHLLKKYHYKDDWRKIALILESIALFFIGLIPSSFNDFIVTNLVSLIMGYQLCLFRKCLDIGFNTTICTGNIRNVGQLLYNTLEKETIDSIKKFLVFTLLTFSFVFGAVFGTLISKLLNIQAVWICSFLLLYLVFCINKSESKNT